MAIHKEYLVAFTPKGLADAWDSTEAFHGACKSLQNLVFDQSNSDLMSSRPGVGNPVSSFASFTGPTTITCMACVGNYLYGMVSTSRLGAFDEPFAYNLLTNTFTSITGTLVSNLPVTQPTSGDWTPPTMAVVGTYIIVTHPGFSGTGANFFGAINITTLSSPVWSTQNLATHALPSVPTCVANFNNRAYFGISNTVYYSDPLNPLNATNAGQSLTLGDTTPVIGLQGLPIQTSTAGVVGALTVFKQFSIWQIIGDAAISGSLALNYLSLNVGCVAPRTIVQTPAGLFFLSIDGPYYISSIAQVVPLTKDQGKLVQDVQRPFQSIVNPSRSCAAFTGSIYRVCIKTTVSGVVLQQDYWFDVTVRRWCGPHTFGYDNITQYSNYFILANSSTGAAFFNSQYTTSPTTTYLDNGAQVNVQLQTCFLPKTANINVKQVVESTIELASQNTAIQYNLIALGEQYQQLANVSINTLSLVNLWGTTAQGGSNLQWGTSLEGGSNGIWSAGQGNPTSVFINWPNPLVFKKIILQVNAPATNGLEVGSIDFKYSDTGYTNI